MLCQPSSRRSSPRPSRAPLRGRRQWECRKFKSSRSQPSPRKSPLCPNKTPSKTACGATNFDRCDQSNQQYSVTALTDTTGTISERYSYDAYGKVSVFDGGGSVLSGSAYGNRYTYTGREWDGELGLYHYRARMYDPVAGRFVSRDPIGFVKTSNLYVNAFLIRETDPTGMAPISWWATGLNPLYNDTTCPSRNSCDVNFQEYLRFKGLTEPLEVTATYFGRPKCRIQFRCGDPDCASGGPAGTTSPPSDDGVIKVCVKQNIGSPRAFLEAIEHELMHARDLCNERIPDDPFEFESDCQICLREEGRAYRVGCQIRHPGDAVAQLQCIKEGVGLSCAAECPDDVLDNLDITPLSNPFPPDYWDLPHVW